MKKSANSIPWRKKIRFSPLKYDQPGSYFITICAIENYLLFGRITGGKLDTNATGLMIEKWWRKLPSKFNRTSLGDFVVMPNHFHGILIIELPRFAGTVEVGALADPNIPGIIQWFKTMSTNEFYRMQKADGISGYPKLWHRSYYDHVIRTDADYLRIAAYIQRNPERWIADRFHREFNTP